MRHSSHARSGLTILEVLISLLIFLLAYGAIHQLMSRGSQQAELISIRSNAARLASSLLNEVAAGSVSIQNSVSGAPVPDDEDYSYSMTSEGGVIQGLYTVRITVTREMQDGQKIEYTLTQMTLDPAFVGSNQDQTVIQGAAETQGATTTESTESTTGTGTEASNPMGGSTGQSGMGQSGMGQSGQSQSGAQQGGSRGQQGGGQQGGGRGQAGGAASALSNLLPGGGGAGGGRAASALSNLMSGAGGGNNAANIRNAVNQLPANIRNQIPANLLPTGGGGAAGGGGGARGGAGGGAGGAGAGRGGR